MRGAVERLTRKFDAGAAARCPLTHTFITTTYSEGGGQDMTDRPEYCPRCGRETNAIQIDIQVVESPTGEPCAPN